MLQPSKSPLLINVGGVLFGDLEEVKDIATWKEVLDVTWPALLVLKFKNIVDAKRKKLRKRKRQGQPGVVTYSGLGQGLNASMSRAVWLSDNRELQSAFSRCDGSPRERVKAISCRRAS